MKTKILSGLTILVLAATIGLVLANNKAKIEKAARPLKSKAIIPVKVYEVKEDSFNTFFSYNGTTSPIKEVKIASEVQGKLVALYIKNGDMVHVGQVIATLDASVFNAQLNRNNAAIEKANLDISRYKRLIDMGGSTPMQLEGMEQQLNGLLAERKEILQQMDHMQIRAPFTGKVENVIVEKGSFVSYGTILGDLINNAELKVKLYLSEQEAFNLQLKQPVSISSLVLDEPIKGEVKMISDKADASGKFLAEINFANNGEQKLKSGMLVDVSFNREEVIRALSIPTSAIIASTKEAKVFVVQQDKVKQRVIKTGIVTTSKVQVLEGLKAGEQVVISGQINLENETVISINK